MPKTYVSCNYSPEMGLLGVYASTDLGHPAELPNFSSVPPRDVPDPDADPPHGELGRRVVVVVLAAKLFVHLYVISLDYFSSFLLFCSYILEKQHHAQSFLHA